MHFSIYTCYAAKLEETDFEASLKLNNFFLFVQWLFPQRSYVSLMILYSVVYNYSGSVEKYVICNVLTCFESFLSVVMVTLAFALLVNFTELHSLAFESVEADFMTQF